MENELTLRQRMGFNVRRGRATRAAELIVAAEQAGVDTAWMTMGAFGSDTLTLYAATAVQTERIRLGASIIPAFTRHPFAMAAQALVLDDIAPGRLRLGIGTSHGPMMAGNYGLDFDRPLSRLREYLQVLRPLLHEGEVEFTGDFYQVKGRIPGTPKTPVLISALGERSFETAGELTDGALSWLTPFDYLRQTARPALDRGAQRAGRDDVPPLIAHVSVALAPDAGSAREGARREFAMYARMPFYQQMFAKAGYPLGSDGEYSDDLLDQLLVAGDEDTVGERLTALLDGDFDEIIVMPVPVSDREEEEQRILKLIGSF